MSPQSMNEPLESRVQRKLQARFGGGSMEKVMSPVDRHCQSKRTTKRIPASIMNLASGLPYCKTTHTPGWTDPPFRGDVVSHRASHCGRGPLDTSLGYWIGLDPGQVAQNRAVAAKYAELLERWQARNALAEPRR